MSTMRANRYAGTGGGGAALARVVMLVATLVAAVLVAGILLTVLGANASNEIVQATRDAARFLAGPFKGLFTFGERDLQVAVNWGLAAVVWYALGKLVARALLRV
jgi:hypothetical protein